MRASVYFLSRYCNEDIFLFEKYCKASRPIMAIYDRRITEPNYKLIINNCTYHIVKNEHGDQSI